MPQVPTCQLPKVSLDAKKKVGTIHANFQLWQDPAKVTCVAKICPEMFLNLYKVLYLNYNCVIHNMQGLITSTSMVLFTFVKGQSQLVCTVTVISPGVIPPPPSTDVSDSNREDDDNSSFPSNCLALFHYTC